MFKLNFWTYSGRMLHNEHENEYVYSIDDLNRNDTSMPLLY